MGECRSLRRTFMREVQKFSQKQLYTYQLCSSFIQQHHANTTQILPHNNTTQILVAPQTLDHDQTPLISWINITKTNMKQNTEVGGNNLSIMEKWQSQYFPAIFR